jgi:hypothetical protein
MKKYLNGPDREEIYVNRITGQLTTSGMAVRGPCAFKGFIIKTDGTNNVTLNIYDNEAAAIGEVLIPVNTVIPGMAYLYRFPMEPGIWCNHGIFVTLSVAGSGTAAIQILYDQTE